MFRIALLVLAFSFPLGGCTSIAFQYTAWKVERKNNRNDRAYRSALADQAYDEQLVGTWSHVRLNPGKKASFTHQKLSLFADNTFALRNTTTGTFWPSIRTATGTWARQTPEGAGRAITLSHDDSERTEDLQLEQWTNAFAKAEQGLFGNAADGYASSILQGEDGLPIVVLHNITEKDLGFSIEHQPFAGGYLPDADTVRLADAALLQRLKQEKPDKQYLRQYGGLKTRLLIGGQSRYLYIQITTADAFEDEPSPDGFGWGGFLHGFHDVWDGGDDYGDALYNVETGEIVSLRFNGNV